MARRGESISVELREAVSSKAASRVGATAANIDIIAIIIVARAGG